MSNKFKKGDKIWCLYCKRRGQQNDTKLAIFIKYIGEDKLHSLVRVFNFKEMENSSINYEIMQSNHIFPRDMISEESWKDEALLEGIELEDKDGEVAVEETKQPKPKFKVGDKVLINGRSFGMLTSVFGGYELTGKVGCIKKIYPFSNIFNLFVYKVVGNDGTWADFRESDLTIVEPDFKPGDRFIVKSSHIFSGYKGKIISSALCGFFVVTFDGFLLEDGESFFIKSKHLGKETPATHVKEEELKVGDKVLAEGKIVKIKYY